MRLGFVVGAKLPFGQGIPSDFRASKLVPCCLFYHKVKHRLKRECGVLGCLRHRLQASIDMSA